MCLSCHDPVILESNVADHFSVINARKLEYKLNSGRLGNKNKIGINMKHVKEKLSDVNHLQTIEAKDVNNTAEYLMNEL